MIKSVLIVNNHGKPRLLKFYEKLSIEQQQQVVQQVFQIVSKRSDHICNFVEGENTLWGADTKIIYRHYATLYIAFVVDISESELGILDLIQVFVEALDKSFQNVCELHLIFHSDQAHYILDEIVCGGMVVETNLKEICAAVDGMERYQTATEVLSLGETSKRLK